MADCDEHDALAEAAVERVRAQRDEAVRLLRTRHSGCFPSQEQEDALLATIDKEPTK